MGHALWSKQERGPPPLPWSHLHTPIQRSHERRRPDFDVGEVTELNVRSPDIAQHVASTLQQATVKG